MTDEQIKRMAEAAGFHVAGGLIMSPYVFGHDHMRELRRFAELARQDERAKCIAAAVEHLLDVEGDDRDIANGIRRARGSDK